MNFPHPVLVCDIGGTNARFAVAEGPGAALGEIVHSRTAAHPTFEAAVAEALPHFAARPRSCVLCAAGPVEGRHLKLTNAAWTIDGPALAKRFDFAQGLLLNDFEAQALSLPALPAEAWISIGPSFVPRSATQVVLGSGTGLGVAALAECDGRFMALASEAGHVDFGPATDEEIALWEVLDTGSVGRVSAEVLLSGPGFVRLHHARLRLAGRPVEADEEAYAITARAEADRTGEEARSVRLFLDLLARFAGDLALTFLARGGVTFSGGILPKLLDFIDPVAFRSRFEAKAPHQLLMHEIGTRLILSEAAVLLGMAAVAGRPDLYAIDYRQRAWC